MFVRRHAVSATEGTNPNRRCCGACVSRRQSPRLCVLEHLFSQPPIDGLLGGHVLCFCNRSYSLRQFFIQPKEAVKLLHIWPFDGGRGQSSDGRPVERLDGPGRLGQAQHRLLYAVQAVAVSNQDCFQRLGDDGRRSDFGRRRFGCCPTRTGTETTRGSGVTNPPR